MMIINTLQIRAFTLEKMLLPLPPQSRPHTRNTTAYVIQTLSIDSKKRL